MRRLDITRRREVSCEYSQASKGGRLAINVTNIKSQEGTAELVGSAYRGITRTPHKGAELHASCMVPGGGLAFRPLISALPKSKDEAICTPDHGLRIRAVMVYSMCKVCSYIAEAARSVRSVGRLTNKFRTHCYTAR